MYYERSALSPRYIKASYRIQFRICLISGMTEIEQDRSNSQNEHAPSLTDFCLAKIWNDTIRAEDTLRFFIANGESNFSLKEINLNIGPRFSSQK